MERKALQELYTRLDDMQQKRLNTLKAQISVEKSAFERIQMMDIAKVIELDMKSRVDLEIVRGAIGTVVLSDDAYRDFLEVMSDMLLSMSGCAIPPEMKQAYSVIGQALQERQMLDTRDIFTCVSVSITVLSLCMPQMSMENQRNAVEHLDRLLGIKSRQLKLLQETERFQRDFSDPFS